MPEGRLTLNDAGHAVSAALAELGIARVAAEFLAAARLRHIAGTQWSTRRYMNMHPTRRSNPLRGATYQACTKA